jgi:hypothetical protein
MDDAGHKALLADLEALLAEARAFQFHDFRNEKYATPKIALHRKLQAIAEKVTMGDYDNRAPAA